MTPTGVLPSHIETTGADPGGREPPNDHRSINTVDDNYQHGIMVQPTTFAVLSPYEYGSQPVADQVYKFTEEFASAIELRQRYSESASSIRAAIRHTDQLTEALAELASSGVSTRSLRFDDLATLRAELSKLNEPESLEPFRDTAEALLQLIGDGIVEGDAERIRTLLQDADSISGGVNRARGVNQLHLETGITAQCRDCDALVVGRRQPAMNWNATTKAIRDHERKHHGEYSNDLRDALSAGLAALRNGDGSFSAGRYAVAEA